MSLDLFLALLTSFAGSYKKYNGVRVYFACYPDDPKAPGVPQGQEGRLTTLFVPTLPVAGIASGADDPGHFYHLYKDQLTQLPARRPGEHPDDLVTSWINHYLRNRRPQLIADGIQKTNKDFKETCSLWYSMQTIAGGPGEMGLINYIRCMQAYEPNPLVGLTTEFACFLPKGKDDPSFPYEYQLTHIFMLWQQHGGDGSGGGSGGGKSAGSGGGQSAPATLAASAAAVAPEAPAEPTAPVDPIATPFDTGLPCPPEANCPGG